MISPLIAVLNMARAGSGRTLDENRKIGTLMWPVKVAPAVAGLGTLAGIDACSFTTGNY